MPDGLIGKVGAIAEKAEAAEGGSSSWCLKVRALSPFINVLRGMFLYLRL
jgi:hypothetical protein